MEKVVTVYLTGFKDPDFQNIHEKLMLPPPDYPSLLSISDTLQPLGIEHQAVRISTGQLMDVEAPWLGQFKESEGLSLKKNKQELSNHLQKYNDENSVADHQSVIESSVVLKAEPTDRILDPENREHLEVERHQKTVFVLLLSAFNGLVLLATVMRLSWWYAGSLLTALAGGIVGYLLFAKEIGVSYSQGENFCKAGWKANCDTILHSDGVRLFGNVSFSDGVAGYFLFQLLMLGSILPFTQIPENFLVPLALFSVLTIPLVLYSLYYQAVKANTWCRLCPLVAAVLVMQAGLFGWMIGSGMFGLFDGRLWAAGMVGGLLLVTSSLVVLIKTRLKEDSKAEQAEAAANRVKYDPSVFTHLLLEQPKVDRMPFEQELLIGNPKVPVQITIAASLGCGPCKDGFEKAKQLVQMYPDTVNLSIRFTIPQQANENQTDPGRYILGYWLHRIYGTRDPSEETENLVQDWFDLADLNQFREQYLFQANGQDPELERLASRHTAWFEKTNIKGTPTFFVNGYKLPEHDRIGDFRSLVVAFGEQVPVKFTGRQKREVQHQNQAIKKLSEQGMNRL